MRQSMDALSRRALLGIASVATLNIPARSFADPDPYDVLISGQYANAIRLKHVSGTYFGADFKPTPSPTAWNLNITRYNGKWGNNRVDFTGYSVFLPGTRKCWQAINGGGSGLRYWNEDGKGDHPEDYEIFTFKAVDKSARTVMIYNTGAFVRWDLNGAPIAARNGFIGLSGEAFACNAPQSNPGLFIVEFV